MSNEALADELIRLFVHRDDIYALQLDSGGYKGNIKEPITKKLIQQHLDGEITLGVYNLAEDDTVKFLAFDIDNHGVDEDDEKYIDWSKLSGRIIKYLYEEYGLTTLFERSGSTNSVHIFISLKPTNAKKVREFGRHVRKHVCNQLGINKKAIEIFPKNDEIEGDEIGNLIKLPCGWHRKAEDWSKFQLPEPGEPLSKHKFRDEDDIVLYLPLNVKPQTLPDISDKINDGDDEDDEDVEFVDDEEIDKKPTSTKEKPSSVPDIKTIVLEKLERAKACIRTIYILEIQLNGEPGHMMRVFICRDLILLGFEDKEIHEFFKTQKDYSYRYTQKKIDEERSKLKKEKRIFDKQEEAKKSKDESYKVVKNHKPLTKCKTMKYRAKYFKELNHTCEPCETGRIATKKAKNGEKLNYDNDIFLPFFIDKWKAIQKHGVRSKLRGGGEGEYILISRKDLIKYAGFSEETYSGDILLLKKLNFIVLIDKNNEFHRIDYYPDENKTTQVIKFDIEETNKKIKGVKKIQR